MPRKRPDGGRAKTVLSAETNAEFLEGLRSLPTIPHNLRSSFQERINRLFGDAYDEANILFQRLTATQPLRSTGRHF